MILTIGDFVFKQQTQKQIMGFSRKLNIFLILFIYIIVLIAVCASRKPPPKLPEAVHDIAWSPLPRSPSSIDPSINYTDFQKWHSSLTTSANSFYYHLLPNDEKFDELSNASD